MRIKYFVFLFILISCQKQYDIILRPYDNTSFYLVQNGNHALMICVLTEEGRFLSFQLEDQYGNRIIFNYDKDSLLSFSVVDDSLGYELINNYVKSEDVFIDRYEYLRGKEQHYTVNENLETNNYYQMIKPGNAGMTDTKFEEERQPQ